MATFAAAQVLKTILRDYYHGFFADDPATGRRAPVAWCTSVGPAEILIACGFKVYYPENHGAMLGATREANRFIPAAHAIGYSPDICSYLTSDIGAHLKGESPLKKAYGVDGPPPPDVLVYSTNQCREMQDWFNFYGKRFGVPVLGIHAPCKVDRMTGLEAAYVADQFQDLARRLEPIARAKGAGPFDQDRLAEVVRLSRQCSDLWKSVLRTAVTRPSPLTFFDGCIQMAPAVVLRGTQVAIDYYRSLLAELEGRVAAGEAAVPGERVRLYWEGMPVWGRLRSLSELLSGLRTAAVASTYCDSWVFDDFDGADPFRSLARGYTRIFINRGEAVKERILVDMCRLYGVDGVIFHDAKTCPYNSNNRFGLPQRLLTEHGIRSLVINGDLSDMRCYSDDQAATLIESFVDQIVEDR